MFTEMEVQLVDGARCPDSFLIQSVCSMSNIKRRLMWGSRPIFALFLPCLSRQCRYGSSPGVPSPRPCLQESRHRQGRTLWPLWANCILQRIDSSNILGWRVFIWLFICDHRPLTLEHWSTSHTGLILCLWRCCCDLMFVQESLHRPLGCSNKLVPVGEEWWFVCEESAAVHIAIREQKHFDPPWLVLYIMGIPCSLYNGNQASFYKGRWG